MKAIVRNVIVLLGLTVALSPAVRAEDTIDQQQAIATGQRLVIEIPRGEISLRGITGEQVSVRGTLDPEREAFEFGPQGDDLVIRVRLPDSWYNTNQGGSGSELTISYPTSSSLAFETISADVDGENLGDALLKSVSGDFTIRGGQANLRLSSVSGDIRASQLNGETSLKTVSGDIALRDASGKLSAESVSGDLEINSLTGEVALESVSGDVDAELGAISRLKVRTVSGDQQLRLAGLGSDSNTALDSVSGDIDLAASQADNLVILADTAPGGDIRNRLTDDEPVKSRYGNSQSLETRLGNGQGQLRLNTVSGSLELSGNWIQDKLQ